MSLRIHIYIYIQARGCPAASVFRCVDICNLYPYFSSGTLYVWAKVLKTVEQSKHVHIINTHITYQHCYCNPSGSPASPVARMKLQAWRVARLKGQRLSALIQSGGFWRHICLNWLGLMHSMWFRLQNSSKCMPKLIQNGPWGRQK